MMKAQWLMFALGSAVFGGVTAILAKIGVSGVDSNLATFYRTAVVLAFAALLVTWRGDWAQLGGLSARNLAFLTLSGIATAASWLCYFRALQLAPASMVAPIDKLSVALTIALSVLFLGEALTLKTAIGALLIISGTVVLIFA